MVKLHSSDEISKVVTRRTASRETNTVDKFVGERIRFYRAMLGMSQQMLAEHLCVTFQQLQKYERGENRIGAGRLLMVAKTLGIPITDLLDEKALSLRHGGACTHAADTPEMIREGYQVGRAFSQILDPAIRRSISTLVQSLASDREDP